MSSERPEFSDKYKLPARSIPEIRRAFGELVGRQEARELQIQTPSGTSRKVSKEAILNAIVMEFLDKPEAEQNESLNRYIPRVEQLRTTGTWPGSAPGEVFPEDLGWPSGLLPGDGRFYP